MRQGGEGGRGGGGEGEADTHTHILNSTQGLAALSRLLHRRHHLHTATPLGGCCTERTVAKAPSGADVLLSPAVPAACVLGGMGG